MTLQLHPLNYGILKKKDEPFADEVEEIFTEIDSLIRISVDYGIEQYFIEEGKGTVVENADDVKVVTKIANNGKAFITDLIVDGMYLNQSVAD